MLIRHLIADILHCIGSTHDVACLFSAFAYATKVTVYGMVAVPSSNHQYFFPICNMLVCPIQPMHSLLTCSCTPSNDRMVFDTDSIPILIDSGASYCMTHDQRDFIHEPVPITTNIQGLGDSKATM